MNTGDSFVVTGGNKLNGTLTPQGAKNEALQILCATLLTEELVIIENLPDILDIRHLIELIKGLGVIVQRLGPNSYSFCAKEVDLDYFGTHEFQSNARKIRGSVMLLAPLLARYKRAVLPKPGGDKIGRRRLDTHFLGLQKLGAVFNYDEQSNQYNISADKLKGTYILMDEISVTGTANIIMAAVMASGETTIYNAACEPYLQQLCKMLNRMGAKIKGIGSNLLQIEGVEKLNGTTHRILPDMIEIGSFISLAAMTQSEILIKDAGVEHLGIIPFVFERMGVTLKISGDDILVPAMEEYEIQQFMDGSVMTIYDAPWPGFTPDLMSVILVMAIQAKGNVLIHQKMFESRLFFVDKLIDMGAQIILCDPHRAAVNGLNRKYPLKGIEMTSPDIRAGVALLIAALSAQGKSVIHSIHQIDRGYERIDERLNAIGAEIIRK
ncbi:MAG: UDP-N-acetylglucosamine 1-carboxyvinyltransferase [Saprospiraceae bacterium]|nr:UDP-N-acetylglucosamine 1-carboxyvinyltransferase [Candidatus Vicinibacter affinis]MBP6173488.1 UDP-N-acetylglucosamine 1-carboxyvinyltransferase [Saprospiraceae bacterium]MBK6573552.1 UDP-N-acetylglucosamine 1-carboxyvinyltransferase [Candidatus Vicinibacter affinis]MBK7302207.1 UDP-N-acetylglucosamine 1-carboxyvinyltransferase [Candidatus Vicinibacter affinis]MBK7693346.1 UDP-N-acetylglucosamine 1-carboxyvinyltransferase [Candidatus Vicinibacter affinis]